MSPRLSCPPCAILFSVKIFFGALLPKEALLGHLHRFDEALQQRIDAYKQIEAYLPKRCRELGLARS
jgi:hypothetical protein